MKKAVPVTQNALYSCFALFVADLYSVDAFCCKDSDPWQEHKSVHAWFCPAQTQDFLFTLRFHLA
jgi:hypothetical protein